MLSMNNGRVDTYSLQYLHTFHHHNQTCMRNLTIQGSTQKCMNRMLYFFVLYMYCMQYDMANKHYQCQARTQHHIRICMSLFATSWQYFVQSLGEFSCYISYKSNLKGSCTWGIPMRRVNIACLPCRGTYCPDNYRYRFILTRRSRFGILNILRLAYLYIWYSKDGTWYTFRIYLSSPQHFLRHWNIHIYHHLWQEGHRMLRHNM